MADYKKDRKQYLINFHTSKDIDQSVFSGDTSRTNSDFEQAVEYGEIVVQHNSDEAALFVRRNGANFAKFIEETVIDEKIEAAVTGASSSITSALTEKIDEEIERALEAESAITSALNDEIKAREDADDAILSALTDETSARTASDEALQGQIDAIQSSMTSGLTALEEALSAETAAREDADEAITSALTSEISARTAADEDLQEQIDELESAMTSGLTALEEALSAETAARISGDTVLQEQINAMDKTANAEVGKVVTTVSEENGVVDETKDYLVNIQLAGYENNSGNTGAITSADTLEVALNRLENTVNAQSLTSEDGSIEITTGTDDTNVEVKIVSDEHVLAVNASGNGLYTDIKLAKVTTGLPETVKERYQLLGTDNAQLGADIDVPKDSHIVSINYITDSGDPHYQNLEYVYIDASGVTQTTYIDMSQLVLEVEFASGVTVTDHIAHGVVSEGSESVVTSYDASGNSATSATVLTVGASGFSVAHIQEAIDAKVAAEINKLDAVDTADDHQYVSSVSEENGVITVARANVSDAKLTGYTKGSSSSAITDDDTINEAFGKLENQVDASKTVVTGSGLTHIGISEETAADGHIVYTLTETDIASDSDLESEIAARKAVDGIDGDVYSANSGTHYISGATSLNNADVLLDTALADIDGKAVTGVTVNGEVAAVSANVATVEIDGTDINVGADVVKSGITYLSSAATVAEAFDLIFTEVLDNEITTSQALLELNSGLSAETAARTAADNALDARVDALEEDARTSINLLEVSGITGVNVTYSSAGTVNTVTIDFSNAVIDGGSF